jgi:hypothetical protein
MNAFAAVLKWAYYRNVISWSRAMARSFLCCSILARSAAITLAGIAATAPAHASSVTVTIDAQADRHPINPMIYGVNFASKTDLAALNTPLNRMGGNATTSYNWANNGRNLGNDWYFESYPGDTGNSAGGDADAFIATSKAGDSEPMITIPLIGWVAKLGSRHSLIPSFSKQKYGNQCDYDPFDSDAGNGLKPDCSTPITGNDVTDSYVKDSVAKEQKWVQHMMQKWGSAGQGGVRYYLMDNEPSIWFDTHRDSHPVGPHATEYRNKVLAESASIKKVDPNALIVGPEEWGWEGFFYSGYDQQYAAEHGYCCWPDHDGIQHGVDYVPWLLKEWKKAGHPLDVLSLHFYPQGKEGGNDTSQATQLLRNRSTRQLWDKNYKSESWIKAPVYLIPRMKSWVEKYYYAGTPIAITEYNWGAEDHINGATTQADIYGIFGREGLDMATRFTIPKSSTPTFKAMQMYRNYDGKDSGFGDTSISTKAPDPDNLSAFAALRGSDGAMTVMVVNKALSDNAAVKLDLHNAAAAGTAQVYRLTASNTIQHLPDVNWSGGALNDTAPAQSITLYVLPQ